mgnify:CR=1 FL=1
MVNTELRPVKEEEIPSLTEFEAGHEKNGIRVLADGREATCFVASGSWSSQKIVVLYDDEDDKSYASIQQTQSYSTPAAQVSPEMAEAMEKFTFWTQEEIQGYFDQGWSIQQLEEWLESQ